MKRVLALIIAICMMFSLYACSRNYTGWKTVNCDMTLFPQAEVDDNSTFFMVPEEWVVSVVGDFWFFASYPIDDLSNIIDHDGELYLVGWVNKAEQVHSLSELLPDVSVPADSAMFSVGVRNGAVYGQEKYSVKDEIWTKYYVSMKSQSFFELKLIDWQNLCGKEMMKNIARTFVTPDVSSEN